MAETLEFLLERLRAEGERTVEFFTSLGPQQWQQQIYADGQAWDIHMLLAHFVATEIGILRLIESVLDGGQGVREGFDITEYNETAVSEMMDQADERLLAMFKEARRRTVEVMGRVSAADLEKAGRHPFLGLTTISEMVKLLYRHNQIHQRDVKRMLAE